ncbi:MAG: shikimate kinase [Ferruginibacter sp.]
MGAGKTYWGKTWALQYDVPFIDLDEHIEKRTGRSIVQLFTEKGESGFRVIETDILRSVNLLDPVLVACGGGTPLYHDNMTWMNRHGTTIFIREEADRLLERLTGDTQKRPLFDQVDPADQQQWIEESMRLRESCYARAALVFNPTDPVSLSIIESKLAQYYSK